jgi:DNA-binding transcriptional ArsR family regulator
MVEYTLSLDSVFGSLADPTRRDILKRVSSSELSVSEIAQSYDLSLAAVS